MFITCLVNIFNFIFVNFERFCHLCVQNKKINMRYILFLFFLSAFQLAFSQVESTNSAPKKDSIEEKESISNDKDLDDNKSVLESEIGTKKKAERLRSYKAMEAEPLSSGAVAKEQKIQTELTNFSYYESQSQTQTQQRSPTKFQQTQMNNAVSYFETNAPESFECHYYKYLSGNYNTDLFPHLQAAEKLRPNNADVQVQMAAYYMINNSKIEALNYLDKLVENKRLVQSVIVYGEDVLISVPANGILITHGFDDTYGVWYAQMKNGVRNDVTVISLDLLQSSKYVEMLKAKGLLFPNTNVIDVAFLNQFCSMNVAENLNISLTTPKEYFKPILSNVYLSGLVFEYKTSVYDNFWRNEKLWNDELKKKLVDNSIDEKGRVLSSNYLPMLFQMRKVYYQMGKTEKVKEMDAAIDKIGAQANRYQQVQNMKSAY